jgi:hypothetical protein
MDPYGEIYLFQFPNGKYVGKTTQGLKVRFKQHLKDMRGGSTYPVHNAMRKYPDVEPEVIDIAYSEEELRMLEIKYIEEHNSYKGTNPEGGYNLTTGGEGQSGNTWSEERKEDWSLFQQQRHVDRPDIAANHSICMKNLHTDDPERGKKHGEKLKDMYDKDPELRNKMSTIKKKQNEENPEMKKQQSELKLMMYEDKPEMKENARKKSLDQWNNPESKQKLLDAHRKKGTKEFNVSKDGIHIHTFDYVPDCALEMFGKKSDGANINKVLKGERPAHKGYVFKYTVCTDDETEKLPASPIGTTPITP